MNPNSYILQILKCLISVGNPTIEKQLHEVDNSFRLISDAKNYIQIDEKSIVINGQNLEEKILYPSEITTDVIDIGKLKKFVLHIAGEITGINHLGISYSCPNIKKEISYYKKLIFGTTLKLFEEKSDTKNNRWFFIGNLDNKNNPLFEIVLTESRISVCNTWVPHFQIDFDTSLSYQNIADATKFLLDKKFIRWKYDIPNRGIVLTMGILGKINGVKIALGIGTNLRGRQTFIEVV